VPKLQPDHVRGALLTALCSPASDIIDGGSVSMRNLDRALQV
jgi:hypothetical protein